VDAFVKSVARQTQAGDIGQALLLHSQRRRLLSASAAAAAAAAGWLLVTDVRGLAYSTRRLNRRKVAALTNGDTFVNQGFRTYVLFRKARKTFW